MKRSIMVLFVSCLSFFGMAYAEASSYIDDHNRFILNGEPFFPLGLYVVECTNGSYAAELDEIADSPFDTLMNYAVNQCGSDATDAQILGYLDQLELRNLKLIFSLKEFFDGAPSAAATWTFTVASNGSYNVYAWWTAGPVRASDAPYTVNYNGGSQIVKVNQKVNGGQWNLLGNFGFVTTSAGSVVLGNDADGIVIADAIKVEGAGPLGTDIILDEEQAAFVSSWTLVTPDPAAYNNDFRWHPRFFDDMATITHKVNTFKTHPAVISWYLNDERDPATYLTQLEERYQKITELDENHPVWSVHWWPDHMLAEAHTTDIVGIDSYPIDNLPITVVADFADAVMQAGKPLWFVPQIFNWQDYPWDFRAATGRPPTREEMRAMSYLATNHGAKGLIYYSYFNIRDDADYGTRWPQIKEIASEIDQLRPVFLSIDQTGDNDIICNNPNIDFKLMREDNAYYLFAVNTAVDGEGDPIPITGVSFDINLANIPSQFQVLFEDRHVVVNNGTFVDDFLGDYAVHVYWWEATQTNNPPNVPSSQSPSDAGTDIELINPVLSWSGGDPDPGDTVTYDVFFGTTDTPKPKSTTQANTTFTLGKLNCYTTYYWQVVARDNNGAETSGPLWSFTTTDVDCPVIEGIEPNPCNPLDMVTITGRNFGDTKYCIRWGRSKYKKKRISSWTDTRIEFRIKAYNKWLPGTSKTKDLWFKVGPAGSKIKSNRILLTITKS